MRFWRTRPVDAVSLPHENYLAGLSTRIASAGKRDYFLNDASKAITHRPLYGYVLRKSKMPRQRRLHRGELRYVLTRSEAGRQRS